MERFHASGSPAAQRSAWVPQSTKPAAADLGAGEGVLEGGGFHTVAVVSGVNLAKLMEFTGK